MDPLSLPPDQLAAFRAGILHGQDKAASFALDRIGPIIDDLRKRRPRAFKRVQLAIGYLETLQRMLKEKCVDTTTKEV